MPFTPCGTRKTLRAYAESTLPQCHSRACFATARQWRGCGNCWLPSSATGSGSQQFLVFSDRCGDGSKALVPLGEKAHCLPLPPAAAVRFSPQGEGFGRAADSRPYVDAGGFCAGAAASKQNRLREAGSCDILRGTLARGACVRRGKREKECKRRDGAL